MSPNRATCAALVTVLVAVGCAEESTTGIAVAETETLVDLVFTFPEITPDILTPTIVEEIDPPAGPARAFGDVSEEPDPGDEPTMDEVSRIWGASTNVGVTSGYAYSTGRHSYSGNTGKVTTEAIILMDGQEIGRRAASRQNYVPFLTDMGQIHEIWAEAYVYTDQECGLTVDGDSGHWAWWQFYSGASAPHWGESSMTTQAFPPYVQPECGTSLEPNSGGGSGAGTDGSGAVTCWYWVTYDPASGAILDAEFLYCDNVEGG
jgi:hypothetical protein